jgi:hypothetical protein
MCDTMQMYNTTIVTLRKRIKTHIIRYHTRNRMQTLQIKFDLITLEISDVSEKIQFFC